VHDRLLEEFPEVNEVLATTTSGTLLIVYEGADTDAWLGTVSETILNYRHDVGMLQHSSEQIASRGKRDLAGGTRF
jgi:hypothetical protein